MNAISPDPTTTSLGSNMNSLAINPTESGALGPECARNNTAPSARRATDATIAIRPRAGRGTAEHRVIGDDAPIFESSHRHGVTNDRAVQVSLVVPRNNCRLPVAPFVYGPGPQTVAAGLSIPVQVPSDPGLPDV